MIPVTINAYYTNGTFDRRVGAFPDFFIAHAAFPAFKTLLPHMTLRMEFCGKVACEYRPC